MFAWGTLVVCSWASRPDLARPCPAACPCPLAQAAVLEQALALAGSILLLSQTHLMPRKGLLLHTHSEERKSPPFDRAACCGSLQGSSLQPGELAWFCGAVRVEPLPSPMTALQGPRKLKGAYVALTLP